MTWIAVALHGMKPFVGHICVAPQDDEDEDQDDKFALPLHGERLPYYLELLRMQFVAATVRSKKAMLCEDYYIFSLI